jgi:tetratricopeptide (TPR) repeat protein
MRIRSTGSSSPARARRGPVTCLLLALTLYLPQEAPAADPFYEEQLRRGQRAYEIGKFDEAARALRIAGFGLLDEPQVLVESLLYLGLAQGAMNEREQWDATFERIVEIEDRFSAYTDLERPVLKDAFEDLVRSWVDAGRLALSPGFESLAPVSGDLAPDPQRARDVLRERLRERPGDVETMLDLASLERQQGRDKRALNLLDQIAEIEPTNAAAQCARLEISHDRRQCEPALSAYPYCEKGAVETSVAAFLLDCLAASGRWNEASALVELLPEDQSSDPALESVIEEVRRNLLESNPPQPFESVTRSAADLTDTRTTTVLSENDAETAARIRKALDEADASGDLEEPIRLAVDLSDRYPAFREVQFLAGEALYRGGRWEGAVEHFRRGGEPTTEQPLLLFYFAVSLFESGETEDAAKALREALPLLERTPFVDSYVATILGE